MRTYFRAFLAYLILALVLCAGPLSGVYGWGPERSIDSDALMGRAHDVPQRAYEDPTPITLDYPRDLRFAKRLHALKFDLWNPHSAMGIPLGAEQGGLYFPLRLPFYIAPGLFTYGLFRVLRLVLAGLGSFALARARGVEMTGALVAGAVLELCGGMIVDAPFAAASAFYCLPWMLVGPALLAGKRYRVGALVSAVAVGMTIHGGHPTLTLLGCLAFAIASVGHVLAGWREPEHVMRMTKWAVGAVAIGLLLGAPALLPFGELLKVGHSYKDDAYGASHWNDNLAYSRNGFWVGTFLPAFVDVLRDKDNWYPYTNHAVFGLATLLLSLVGLFAGRGELATVLVLIWGVALCYAPPGTVFLTKLPLVHYILPRYAWPLLAVPIAQLAGSGLEVLREVAGRRLVVSSERPVGVAAKSMRADVALTLTAVLTMMAVAFVTLPMFEGKYRTVATESLEKTRGWVSIYVPPIVLFVAVALFLIFAPRSPLRAVRALGALAVLELALYAIPHVNSEPAYALREPLGDAPVRIGQLARDSHTRVSTPGSVTAPNLNLLADIPDARVSSALVPTRFWRYLNAMEKTTPFTSYIPPRVHSPLFDMAAIRYVIGSHGDPAAPFLEKDEKMPLLFSGRAVDVYENHAAAPRVRILHGSKVVDRIDDAFAEVVRLAGGSRHLAESGLQVSVVLEPAADGKRPEALGGTALVPTDDAQFIRDDSDVVSVRAKSTTPGYLVLADTYYPGWTATVDGASTPIFPANGLFRAVALPPGEHVVTFRYGPWSFRVGLMLLVLGLGGVAWLAVRVRRERAGWSSRAKASASVAIPAAA